MQVQAQLLCTQARYCDFVVYTGESIHIERIESDPNFLEDNVEKAKCFFETAVLPKLLGKWYSRLPVTTQSTTQSSAQSSDPDPAADSCEKYCYCQKGLTWRNGWM